MDLIEGNSHCKFNNTTKSQNRISFEQSICRINVRKRCNKNIPWLGKTPKSYRYLFCTFSLQLVDDDAVNADDDNDDDEPIVRISCIELQLAFIVEFALSGGVRISTKNSTRAVGELEFLQVWREKGTQGESKTTVKREG